MTLTNMRVLIFCILSSCGLFATEVQIYRADSEAIAVELTVYERPIHFSRTRVVDLRGGEEPAWLGTYLNKNNIMGLEYSEWVQCYSPALIQSLGVSEDQFLQTRKKYGASFGVEKDSILFDVHLKQGSQEFYYVVLRRGEFVDTFDEDVEVRGSGFFFEKVKGDWLLTLIPPGHSVNYFSFNDLSYLTDVLEKKNVIAPAFDGDYIRYFDGAPTVFEFFE